MTISLVTLRDHRYGLGVPAESVNHRVSSENRSLSGVLVRLPPTLPPRTSEHIGGGVGKLSQAWHESAVLRGGKKSRESLAVDPWNAETALLKHLVLAIARIESDRPREPTNDQSLCDVVGVSNRNGRSGHKPRNGGRGGEPTDHNLNLVRTACLRDSKRYQIACDNRPVRLDEYFPKRTQIVVAGPNDDLAERMKEVVRLADAANGVFPQNGGHDRNRSQRDSGPRRSESLYESVSSARRTDGIMHLGRPLECTLALVCEKRLNQTIISVRVPFKARNRRLSQSGSEKGNCRHGRHPLSKGREHRGDDGCRRTTDHRNSVFGGRLLLGGIHVHV